MTKQARQALFILICLLFSAKSVAQQPVWLIDIKGAIGPATADHVVRGIEKANEANASLVVLRIDTPGGLDTAMREMIKAILASDTPIAGYVAPGGARAASAGTYILYACHIAAMSPATNLGAATPVKIGGPSFPRVPSDQDQDTSDSQPDEPRNRFEPKTAMERKIINDAIAYIEGLAELRGRNAEWAAKAVREGASLSAQEAQQLQVVDLVAGSLDELLAKLQGREISVGSRTVELDIASAELHRHEADWRSEFLSVITNPNVAYILMLVGIYGLIFEFSNPGMGVPGIVGAVCLLLALYAFQVLPVSYAGLGLIILGVGLMVAEAFAPSFGVLGLGGIVAFVVGSIILMDTELPGYQIAMPIIVAFAVFSGALLVFALGLVLKARRSAVVTGMEHLIGASAMVETVADGRPLVRLEGELWQVECDKNLEPEDSVHVASATGVVLTVTKD